jgi:hypothetical protein
MRYYAYHFNGIGVSPVKLSIPLTVGTYVHQGLEILLNASMNNFEISDPEHLGRDWVDIAVEKALKGYMDEIESRNFDLEANEDILQIVTENKNIIEALIRAYAVQQLPILLRDYEVVDVEREEVAPLFKEYVCRNCNGTGKQPLTIGRGFGLTEDNHPSFETSVQKEPCGLCGGIESSESSILWMARADALLRERKSGDLHILSFKTASQWGDKQEKENQVDVQGLSELWAIEQRLGKLWNAYQKLGPPVLTREEALIRSFDTPPKISGIKMEFLIKGKYSKSESSFKKEYQTFLLHPYMKEGITPDLNEYKFDAYYTCEESHKWQWATGGVCEGQKKHKLGKDWNRVDITEHMTIKEWVEKLSEMDEKPLRQCFAIPVIYERNTQDVNDWKEQTISQESKIKESIDTEPVYGTPEHRSWLNQNYPQYKKSCHSLYGNDCAYLGICFGTDKPTDHSLYQIRTPNHQLEKERFEGVEAQGYESTSFGFIK